MNLETEIHCVRSIQKSVWQVAEDHGFHDVGQTFGDQLMLIVSEAAEALEDFREGHGINETWFEGQKPRGIPNELADIVIRVLDVAQTHGVDLADMIAIKTAYNRTRPHLHGKTF